MRTDITRKRSRSWKAGQDAAKKYRTKQKTNLLAAARHYGVKKPRQVHRALADAATTLEIFKKQMSRGKYQLWRTKQQP